MQRTHFARTRIKPKLPLPEKKTHCLNIVKICLVVGLVTVMCYMTSSTTMNMVRRCYVGVHTSMNIMSVCHVSTPSILDKMVICMMGSASMNTVMLCCVKGTIIVVA